MNKLNDYLNVIMFQSAVQDLDFENELDLLYAVVTLPSSDGEGTCAWLYFIDDNNGHIIKAVSLPTWKPVSIYFQASLFTCI